MRRVAIIGSPGAGKSTFALRLAANTGLPVFHLDRLYWKAGWVAMPRDEWLALQRQLVACEAWIIDGNYSSSMDLRIAAADTIIFLDLPRRVCVYRAFKRVLLYHGQTRPDMAEGCPEKVDLAFLRFIWTFRQRWQPDILGRLDVARGRGKTIVHLRSAAEIEGYLGTLC